MNEVLTEKLPVGRSTFHTLREQGKIYVDKTAQIYELAVQSQKFFFARPRRFGKSLLISTFESLFRDGLKDFKGLAIESLWKDKTYDVVTLDFSTINEFKTKAEFKYLFEDMLLQVVGRLGFKRERADADLLVQLGEWMKSRPAASLVMLVDEYDAPLTLSLANPPLFDEVRDALSRFYSVVKSAEGCLRFFFMTGITKIENASIFSAFNPITDISFRPQYGSLAGYTEAEIEQYFGGFLDRACRIRRKNETREALLAELRRMYDGFCFDLFASTHVYVPWSVLQFLADPGLGFLNYWHDGAGRSTLLTNFLTMRGMDKVSVYASEKMVTFEELFTAADLASLDPTVLLAQVGYLTIKEADNGLFTLGYPNQEVRESMARFFVEMITRDDRLAGNKTRTLRKILLRDDFETVVETVNRIITGLDYVRWNLTDEASCRNAVQLMLAAAGLNVQPEKHNALGRSDLEVSDGNRYWVLEFKWARKGRRAETILEEALRQLKNRRYGDEVPPDAELHRIALVFSEEARKFVLWQEVPAA